MRRIALFTIAALLTLSLVPVADVNATDVIPERKSALAGDPAAPFPREATQETETMGALSSSSLAATTSSGSVVRDGADWLLGQQDAAGWFPFTPGGGATANTQGPSARGLLKAYEQTGDSTYLDAAVDTGDYLVPNYPREYSDNDPRFATADPLFLEELSQATGGSTYSDFVQTYFWDKLADSSYGEDNDMDAAAFGDAVVDGRKSSGIVALSPWDLAPTAIAAHLAGETNIRNALMSKVLRGLNETVEQPMKYDVAGLAGAVWASAVTGVDLDPTDGVYATDDSTADLAETLVGMQLNAASGSSEGGWPYGTRGPIPEFTNDGNVWKVAFGNYFETTLTKKFENVTDSTISFDMRMNIEEDWDYGQVLVSTDGTIFESLAGSYTTTDDTNGNNPGNGITGWVENDQQVKESMTIPDFVSGSDYWVRFRFVADAATSGNDESSLGFNWEIDNITVNENTDDCSTENGWTVESEATDKASTQNTAFAALALHAVDPFGYVENIAGAVEYIRGVQEPSGQFLTYPDAAWDKDGSVEVHAEALAAHVTVGHTQLDALFYPYDQETPRGVDDAPGGWGDSAWQGPASDKSNYHVWYDASGGNPAVNLEELFGVDHDLTVGDLESISYHTKKDFDETGIDDWWLSIYTKMENDGDNSGTWYDSRLHARPDVGDGYSQSGTDDAWNLWSTDDGASGTNQLVFFDGPRGYGGYYKTLANLAAGSVDWDGDGTNDHDYSGEELKSITLQTDSGWDGFDGYVDGLTIILKDGSIGKVNFEAASLWLEPSDGWVETSGTTTVDVMMSGSGFNGVQFDLAYNNALLSVNSVQKGSMWDGYPTNLVQNEWGEGTIEFGAFLTQMDTTLDVSEAQVATITFAGDADGISDLTFSNVIVSDLDGRELVYQAQDGTLEVYGRGTIEGQVELQGRFVTGGDTVHHEGAKITLTGGPGGGFSFTDTTLPDGTWSIDNVVEGSYEVLVEMSLYLTAERSSPVQLVVNGDGTADAGFVKLLGGDVNNLSGDPALGNNIIGTGDAAVVAATFGLSDGEDDYNDDGDINDDNTVNILDCSILGGNYGKEGPVNW